LEQALDAASDDPVERVHAFVSAFASWHADNHALARVIQYEFKKLPRGQFRQIVGIRDRFEQLMREECGRGRGTRVGGHALGGVAPGGEIVEEIAVPEGLGGFACGLGGEDGRTLVACAAPDFHEEARKAANEAVLLTTTVEVPHAGLP
jgi:hypothetical protein